MHLVCTIGVKIAIIEDIIVCAYSKKKKKIRLLTLSKSVINTTGLVVDMA